jgi:hypothetical protein
MGVHRFSLASLALELGPLAALACSSSSSPGPTDAAAADGEADAPSADAPVSLEGDAAQVDAADVACVPSGGVYTCLGGSWPSCPGGSDTALDCPSGFTSCMGCTEGAGFVCTCSGADAPPLEAGEPAAKWLCVGTEHACQ